MGLALLAKLAISYAPEVLSTIGEKLGLSKGATATLKKVATIVTGAGGDEAKVEAELGKLPPQVQLVLVQAFTQIEDRRFEHDEVMGEQELERVQSGHEMWKHDTEQEDKFVSRCRPTGLYLFYGVILVALIIVPIITAIQTGVASILQLPSEFWATFTAAFIGYGTLRTLDKRTAAGKPLPKPMQAVAKLFGMGGSK